MTSVYAPDPNANAHAHLSEKETIPRVWYNRGSRNMTSVYAPDPNANAHALLSEKEMTERVYFALRADPTMWPSQYEKHYGIGPPRWLRRLFDNAHIPPHQITHHDAYQVAFLALSRRRARKYSRSSGTDRQGQSSTRFRERITYRQYRQFRIIHRTRWLIEDATFWDDREKRWKWELRRKVLETHYFLCARTHMAFTRYVRWYRFVGWNAVAASLCWLTDQLPATHTFQRWLKKYDWGEIAKVRYRFPALYPISVIKVNKIGYNEAVQCFVRELRYAHRQSLRQRYIIDITPDPNAPDTLGWRAWYYDPREKILKSPIRGTPWETEELRDPAMDRKSSSVEMHTGIHARRLPRANWRRLQWKEPLPGTARNDAIIVTGIVERFGASVIGETGWRAEHVVIRELQAPTTEIGLELERRYPLAIIHYHEEGQ